MSSLSSSSKKRSTICTSTGVGGAATTTTTTTTITTTTTSNAPSKKDKNKNMTLVPLYQIDFSAKNTGKTLALTKKCVRFHFGYANPKAWNEGKAGELCRGEEHILELQWSLVTGKRHVFIDDKEIHSSTLARFADPKMPFQLKFHMKSTRDHVCHLLAFATTPPTSATTSDKRYHHVRQFDLRFGTKGINRRSFFDLPKIYQLQPEGHTESIYVLFKNPSPKSTNELAAATTSLERNSTTATEQQSQPPRRTSISVIEEEESNGANSSSCDAEETIDLFNDLLIPTTTTTTSNYSKDIIMQPPTSERQQQQQQQQQQYGRSASITTVQSSTSTLKEAHQQPSANIITPIRAQYQQLQDSATSYKNDPSEHAAQQRAHSMIVLPSKNGTIDTTTTTVSFQPQQLDHPFTATATTTATMMEEGLPPQPPTTSTTAITTTTLFHQQKPSTMIFDPFAPS